MEENLQQLDIDPELLAGFLDESEESLASLDSLFIKLEQRGEDKDIVSSIFRVAHSIKGLAGFLGLDDIKDLTHQLETVLALIRDNKLIINSSLIDTLLAGFDLLSSMIADVREGKFQTQDKNRLQTLMDQIQTFINPADRREKETDNNKQINNNQKQNEETKIKQQKNPGPNTSPASSSRSMRVSEEKIDMFMQYVGDLIEISESFNLMQKRIETSSDRSLAGEFKNVNNSFNQLSDKLQRSLLAIRKIPANNLVQKIPRMVRDLANSLNKKVQVQITGQDTQVDKSMVEALESPINHLVRNCVDHGIESPQDRSGYGKNETGNIEIAITEQGDDIMIKISDDGAGIDTEKIRQKAINMQLVTEEQAAQMTKSQILQFIFHSGFSTAKKVTDVSGRGVGMDVVRTNIESLKGSISLDSDTGKGTTITLKLPSSLTVLVVSGMLAGVGKEQYIIKFDDIQEVIRPRPEDIKSINSSAQCLHVRHQIFPLIKLHRLFNVEPRSTDPTDSMAIIAQTKNHRAAILVDEVLGQQRAVVKELSSHFSDLKTVAGTAVLANTKVGLVLDIPGIIETSLTNRN